MGVEFRDEADDAPVELMLAALNWVELATVVCPLGLLGLYLLFPEPRVLLITGVALGVGWPALRVSRRLARTGRVEAAFTVGSAGVLVIAVTVALFGNYLFFISTLMLLSSIAVSTPYISPKRLRHLFIASLGVVAFGAVVFVRGPLIALDYSLIPLTAVQIAVACYTVVFGGICALGVWHSSGRLLQTLAEMRETNRALRDSERLLETKVEERTAELIESQRDLALARDDAVAANRHKSAFLANMSHELRTPLNAILGFSEMLEEKVFGDLNEKQAEYVNDIHSSGQHLLSLINEVLDLSKVEAGRMELALSRFELSAAIGEALLLSGERATRHGVTLEKRVAPGVGELEADERKVKQILINLLSNAIKFTEEGGSIEVRATANHSEATISVADTGVGIAPEDQELVFEEFRQAGGDYSRKAAGTGLGLALVKRLVELHGGRVWLESQVGRGSTFSFTLPLAAAREKQK